MTLEQRVEEIEKALEIVKEALTATAMVTQQLTANQVSGWSVKVGSEKKLSGFIQTAALD